MFMKAYENADLTDAIYIRREAILTIAKDHRTGKYSASVLTGSDPRGVFLDPEDAEKLIRND